MAVTRTIEAEGRAKALVDRLRADWLHGLDWKPVVIEDIALMSPPDTWPPVIRLDFRAGDRQVRWEDPWDGEILRDDSLAAASNLWLAIVHAHLCEQGYL
jgi:hypothetical protein